MLPYFQHDTKEVVLRSLVDIEEGPKKRGFPWLESNLQDNYGPIENLHRLLDLCCFSKSFRTGFEHLRARFPPAFDREARMRAI